jgi:hypothetical protein
VRLDSTLLERSRDEANKDADTLPVVPNGGPGEKDRLGFLQGLDGLSSIKPNMTETEKPQLTRRRGLVIAASIVLTQFTQVGELVVSEERSLTFPDDPVWGRHQ